MTDARWSRIAGAVSIVLTLAYPLAIYLFIDHGGIRWAGLALMIALAVRFLLPGGPRPGLLALIGLGMAFAGAIVFTQSELLARLYPVAVSAAMLLVFGVTLLSPPSMVERIARAAGSELDAAGELYTLNVTRLWCGFFLINGCLAAATALFGSRELWALYNGLLSYVAAGILFGGERLVRPLYQRRHRIGVAP